MASLYPLFLNLEHKTVLIVGGGTLAAQKLRTLAPTGAHVMLVAPHIAPETLALLEAGGHRFAERRFAPTDLDSVDMVFAATDTPETNHGIVALARDRGILANAVDDPAFCDFYTPAVVRRGLVSVAISTDGRFPGVTRALREVLDEWLPKSDETLVAALADLREELRAANVAPAQRATALRTLIAQFRDRYLRPTTGHSPSPEMASLPMTTRREGTQDDIYIS
ncbi:MAG TPA: bifunctional precorrin-2 dehydrogenase/sirohydrochlorin ferrochelatase [bacterium]